MPTKKHEARRDMNLRSVEPDEQTAKHGAIWILNPLVVILIVSPHLVPSVLLLFDTFPFDGCGSSGLSLSFHDDTLRSHFITGLLGSLREEIIHYFLEVVTQKGVGHGRAINIGSGKKNGKRKQLVGFSFHII